MSSQSEVFFAVVNEDSGSELGTRLKRFRADASLTQARLAELADVSPAYISELENGAANRPSGQVLLQLAEALGATIADLLGTAPSPPDSRLEVSESLRQFAEAQGLAQGDVEMLASIRFRGEKPRSQRRWGYIYESIIASSRFDDEA